MLSGNQGLAAAVPAKAAPQGAAPPPAATEVVATGVEICTMLDEAGAGRQAWSATVMAGSATGMASRPRIGTKTGWCGADAPAAETSTTCAETGPRAAEMAWSEAGAAAL